jgi:hypothetical protein
MQYNFLRKLVKTGNEADKNCEDEPKRMEKLLMDSCQTMVGIKGPQDDKKLYGAGDAAYINAAARRKRWRLLRQIGTLMKTRSLFCCYPHLNEVDRLSYLQYLLNLER